MNLESSAHWGEALMIGPSQAATASFYYYFDRKLGPSQAATAGTRFFFSNASAAAAAAIKADPSYGTEHGLKIPRQGN